jgi:hypothetical protein
MKKSIIAIGAVIVALVVVLVVFLSQPAGGPDRAREDAIVRQNSDPTLQYQQSGDGGSMVDGAETEVSYEQVLDDYRHWAQYPPDSRPLKANYTDQIEHHWIPLPPRPMPIIGPDGKAKDPQHACLLQPLNHTVTEGQQMEVTLQCRAMAGDGAGQGAPLEIKNIRLVRYFDEKEYNTEQPRVTEGDKANKFTYRLTYVPRKDDWGDMELTVDFVVPAEKEPFTHTLKAHFFSSPVAPAQFRGVVAERIQDGSLIIVAEVNARFAGRYTIEANLFNEDGPVAVARTDARLKAGPQNVEIQFFGKIFHDQNAPGPYQVVALRGEQDTSPLDPADLNLPPEEVEKMLSTLEATGPQKRTIPTWEGKYTTETYRLEDFSNAEWDSEIKRERMAELKQLAGEY